MKIQMRLRLPADDLSALDEMAKPLSRSEYVTAVLDNYTRNRKMLLEMFDDMMCSISEEIPLDENHSRP